MKHIKTFESWFTNIFKSGGDHWQDFEDDYISHSGIIKNYNALVGSAEEGNWRRFKKLLPEYRKNINDIQIYNVQRTSNILISVIKGDGDLWEKKKMITALIHDGVDPYFADHDGNSFYDYIKDKKLKKWIDETYPEIVEQLELNKSINKYNL